MEDVKSATAETESDILEVAKTSNHIVGIGDDSWLVRKEQDVPWPIPKGVGY